MPRTFEGNVVSPKGRFAITVSRFNSFITDPLLAGARVRSRHASAVAMSTGRPVRKLAACSQPGL